MNCDQSAQALHRQFTDMQRSVPRFLFRGWNEHSGGDARLNSKTLITTKSYLHHPRPVIHLSQKPFKKIRSMITDHIHTRSGVVTEFSSWSASFSTAWMFGTSRGQRQHISVIDREQLRGNVSFYWVPDLIDAEIIEEPPTTRLPDECLAHGPIEGAGLYCIALKTYATDAPILYREMSQRYSPYRMFFGDPMSETADATVSDVSRAIEFAQIYLSGLRVEHACHRAWIQSELQPLFYFLVLTWLGRGRPRLTPSRQSVSMIHQKVLSDTGIDVPSDLWTGTHRDIQSSRGPDGDSTRLLIQTVLSYKWGHGGGRFEGGSRNTHAQQMTLATEAYLQRDWNSNQGAQRGVE